MDTTKFTMGIVGLVVIILMVTGAVIPAVENAQKDQYSTDNNSNELYVIAESTEATPTNPIELELTVDGFIIINGVTDTQAFTNYSDKIWAENVGIQVGLNSGAYKFLYAYWTDATTVSTNLATKLVYNGSSLAVYDGTTLKFEVDSDYFIYPYSKGTYGQFDQRTASLRADLHINKESVVYVGTNGNGYGFMKGTYADGFQQVGYSGSATLDTRTLTYTSKLSEDGLTWQFDSKPIMVLSDSAEVEESTTSDWINIYAPIEYKYISDNDASIISLVGIIPLMLIIVAVLYAVRLMGASRN